MRHRQSNRKLNRTTSHRLAMLRNMTNSLLKHELIKTTLPKAKELRRVAEPLITLGKTPTLANRRLAFNRTRDRDIVGKLFTEVRPLHLDHHAPPVPELRRVDLAQARASQRFLLERCEQLTDTRMQLLLYRLLHNLVGHWRDFVLEVLELVDVLLWKKVGPRGQHLTELDVGGSELDQALAKRLGLGGRFFAVRCVSSRDVGAIEIEQPLSAREIAQAVVGKQPERRGEARKMLRRENHVVREGRNYALSKWPRIASP